MMNCYEIRKTEEIISPSLIYYLDIIRSNIQKAIEEAGSAERLWPHVKSHKSIDMLKLQMKYGIVKFKAATVAEAEMAAQAGAERIILAYPLIGPNIGRYVELAKAYPNSCFYAIGDDAKQLKFLSDNCMINGFRMSVLADVNMGMDRTGVTIDKLEAFYRIVNTFPGICMKGLHCYDGNHNNKDIIVRNAEVAEADLQIETVLKHLRQDGIECGLVVAGGTPSFPCHAENTNWYLSPGTAFITDAGYYKNLPDLGFIPGAAVMTRVISHPAPGLFATDLGYKGIASDPVVQRGYIVGLEEAVPVIHSEEHWVFKMEDAARIPAIGTCLYVIPTHICPTSALYPEILLVKNGEVINTWKVTARNRKLSY
ncbi:D-TA family PLP-dependent enzyme [Lacrimispora sp.]|uniref:D-TA family PLP-dependent enzyme n=1 Tax=Lacrimispora sp. TaxID=2719234 RepID=UPI00285DCE58|nr:D-TA family PLP-dependent enzyme [Lacrimispora sp.]MDR7810924.1 D-TA family PLP-dependent enzyme [Lacrimispora sp.]